MDDRDLVLSFSDGLALDFANTRYWRGSPEPTERLHSVSDLLDWCAQTGGIPARAIEPLRKSLVADATAAATIVAEARALRETVYGIFRMVAEGKKPREDELRALNRALATTPPRRELRKKQSGFGWALSEDEGALSRLLAPVLWSASDLLASERVARVRRCANDACLWLFLDDSKSGNRRWCSMSACGNRAKAHRHYLRQKA